MFDEFYFKGSVELAAVGVSISVFNLVSKLFNIPLLNVTTSFVAEDASKASQADHLHVDKEECQKDVGDRIERKQLPAVSTALVLAVGLGFVEAASLAFGTGPFFLHFMGLPSVSLSIYLLAIVHSFCIKIKVKQFHDYAAVPDEDLIGLSCSHMSSEIAFCPALFIYMEFLECSIFLSSSC